MLASENDNRVPEPLIIMIDLWNRSFLLTQVRMITVDSHNLDPHNSALFSNFAKIHIIRLFGHFCQFLSNLLAQAYFVRYIYEKNAFSYSFLLYAPSIYGDNWQKMWDLNILGLQKWSFLEEEPNDSDFWTRTIRPFFEKSEKQNRTKLCESTVSPRLVILLPTVGNLKLIDILIASC